MDPMRLIVGITGASGAIYGIRLLEVLKAIGGIETHLVLSKWGEQTIELETSYTVEAVRQLATVNHPLEDLAATISSGSFRTDGMVILPCSMKTLASIAHGLSDNLLTRVADVMLKEGRKLVLCPRETPLSPIHLENMLKLAGYGVRIIPPMPAFYNQPQSLDDIINHSVMKILDQFDIPTDLAKRWQGVPTWEPEFRT